MKLKSIMCKTSKERTNFKPFRVLRTLFAFFLFFIGCSSGPRAKAMETPSGALQEAFDRSEEDSAIVYTEVLPEEWWTLFNDEQLTKFIQIAYARNPTLHEAKANILLAAYNADLVRSTLYPNLNWGADVLREKFSQTGIIPFNTTGQLTGQPPLIGAGGVAGIPVYFTQYETEFILTYDFDLWGKRKSLVRAALGEVQSKIADEIFIRLELGVALANTYFQLQVQYKRQEIAQRQIEIRERLLELTQQRVDAHIDTDFAVINAEASLARAWQIFYQIQEAIAIQENQLRAYLAGSFDEEICRIEIVDEPLPQVPLPVNIPLNLVAHRPDIIAQLWLLESAGEQIKSAKAGFYPDFSLTALFGYQTIHFKKLFEWPSSYYSVDPAVLLPVFDGGRLLANLNVREVDYDKAIYEYNQLVLNAAREVLDGIAVLRYNEKQLDAYYQISLHTEKSYELTQFRAQNNLSSDLDILNSESNMLVARDQEVVALGNTMQAVLLLIKALGGGYEACLK